ncbi:MAG: hypothetical protein WB497_19135, partial [Pseudolabrys sp.]
AHVASIFERAYEANSCGGKKKAPPDGGASLFLVCNVSGSAGGLAAMLATLLLLAGLLLSALLTTLLLTALLLLARFLVRILILIHFITLHVGLEALLITCAP